MYPPNHLIHIVKLTNVLFKEEQQPSTIRQEILKFFGVLILITRFEFNKRSDLWSNEATSKYIPAASFGQTGMTRKRFDILFETIRFSKQPKKRPLNTSSEEYRWTLVDDFINAFNLHRQEKFSPSHLICVDESISRWYGLGGSWINEGLPCYVAIDQKPENSCEIQNAACGVSGVMLQLKVVKNKENDYMDNSNDREKLLHGCKILKKLVEPWWHSNRIVCADSYFASVGTTEELGRLGLRLISVIKTATRGYPMSSLQGIEFEKRGDWKGMVHKVDNVDTMYAFVWVDRE